MCLLVRVFEILLFKCVILSFCYRSTLSIRLFLKEFCILFVENCYNSLMHAVKVSIVKLQGKK